MLFLGTAITILLIAAFVFFLIFSYICLHWTNRNIKEAKNIFGGIMVSFLYTFKILLLGFLLILIVSLFLDKPF